MEVLEQLDRTLFLFLNGFHTDALDLIMYWISYKLTWIPWYLFLFYLLYKAQGKQAIYTLLAAVLLIALSDQSSVHLFKENFMRYRPCHNLEIQDKVFLVKGCGGLYGFISSHASNTFALATFLSLVMRRHYKALPTILIIWASVVSFSRIYVGVHYPADILAGALHGAFLGGLVYRFYSNLPFVNLKQSKT